MQRRPTSRQPGHCRYRAIKGTLIYCTTCGRTTAHVKSPDGWWICGRCGTYNGN